MTALAHFDNVPVVPVTAVKNHIALGGPIWPDFSRHTAPRHCRNGRPVDTRPAPMTVESKFRRAAIWGGYLDPAFGHLVAEQLSRLPQALAARPKDLVLFTLPPGTAPEAIPAYQQEVLGWLGIDPRLVRFITVPRLAPELRVAPQAEMLGGPAPAPDYLDLLDGLTARHRLDAAPRLPLVYVTRAGLAAKGRGAHLGESYLVAQLLRLGVQVVDPAEFSIRDQMQIYALADVLVFAEGSALHGRQLMGRLAQDIHVLTRRPGTELAKAQLAPRCRSLAYHDVSAELLTVTGALSPRAPKTIEFAHLTASFYDLEALFRAFDRLGVGLARHWSMSAYREAALADALRWLVAQNIPVSQSVSNLNRILQQIAPEGEPLAPSAPPKAGTALH